MNHVASGEVDLSVGHERIGDGGPKALFVHATGFCKEVWRPVLDEIAASGVGIDATLLDQRGHGGSSPITPPLDWWQLGEDVLTVLDGHRDVIGVGHSAGGVALALADILAPGTFRSLVLVEPVIPAPPFKRIEDHPLALGALKRTRQMPSRASVIDRYRGRGPFAGWDERAFQGWVDGGWLDDPEAGEGAVRLACRPQDEAEFYRSAFVHRGFSRLGEIVAPVEIIAGEESGTSSPRFVGLLAGRMRLATVTWVPEANHFVPMQRPDVVATAAAGAASGEWSE
ncbi:MAG: alpha/beta hydrolase [bacterium]|nr:alpha/beta hydrolase [bacterium]